MFRCYRQKIAALLVQTMAIMSASAFEVGDSVAVDSMQHYDLHEVVVQGRRAWIEGQKVVFIPDRKEKNLSNSPETLLRSMNIPFIREFNQSLVGRNGKPVVYFINGVRANEIDIANFWPKNAKRVEYLENPTDPTFEGVAVAVNFIMTEYAAGGVSKINAFQKIPDRGLYTASSKLVYKKMDYGVMLKGHYDRDHSGGKTGNDTYSNFYYDNIYRKSVSRLFKENNWSRNQGFDVVFNATYQAQKFRMRHQLALSWDCNPGSGSKKLETWDPDLFGSSIAATHYDGKTFSPQISGVYFIKASEQLAFNGSWQYSYARNKLFSTFSLEHPPIIENATSEDVHSLRISINPSFRLSGKTFF